jgi:acyl-coenzyme A thioesterase PaaI-like protein
VTEEEARRRTALRLRNLADRLALESASPETWEAVTSALDAAEGLLPVEPAAETALARRFSPDADPATATLTGDDPVAQHPLAQASSAVYPPIDLSFEGDRLVADVAFGPAWEGPPGLVHGGYVAAGFDIVCSAMASRRQGPTMTRFLNVRYLKPSRYRHRLRYEVEVEREEGRLLDLRATLLVEGRVTARATAQFASMGGR